MIYIAIIAGIFTLDFFTKKHIDKNFQINKRHDLVRNIIYIQKYYNKGAALNFLEKHPKFLKWLQTLLMAVVSIYFYFSMKRSGNTLEKLGTAFLIGGGLNNLYDRYTKGQVVDYIKFAFGPKWFRKLIFNVSDFFVFIGAAFVVLGQ